MDIARSLQLVTEEAMLSMARHAHQLTRSSYLCLAGGVALNCVGNGRILREGPFQDIWIQPAAGDAGGALGAALLAWHHHRDQPRAIRTRGDVQRGSLLGPEFDARDFLNRESIAHTQLSDDELMRQVAGLLDDGKVVGWFQGRMEFGPRALGQRSILADPRAPQMQERLNQTSSHSTRSRSLNAIDYCRRIWPLHRAAGGHFSRRCLCGLSRRSGSNRSCVTNSGSMDRSFFPSTMSRTLRQLSFHRRFQRLRFYRSMA
jgi:hypothetical protein